MYLLHKVHIREVSVTAWPDELHRICEERNIQVLRYPGWLRQLALQSAELRDHFVGEQIET